MPGSVVSHLIQRTDYTGRGGHCKGLSYSEHLLQNVPTLVVQKHCRKGVKLIYEVVVSTTSFLCI